MKNRPVYSVILFGSYAKKLADENSDLDFVIYTKRALWDLNYLA